MKKGTFYRGLLVLVILLSLLAFVSFKITEKIWFNPITIDLGIDKEVDLPKQAIATSIVINFGVDFSGSIDSTQQNILVNYIEATKTKSGNIYTYQPKTLIIYNSDTTGYNMVDWTNNIGRFIEQETVEVLKAQYKQSSNN